MTLGIAIVSGGMDSVTLAYDMANAYDDLVLVSFDYGQRHRREIVCAQYAAAKLGAEHLLIPVDLAHLLTGSALTDPDVPVPHGHYAAETMRATVVPNRNAIMLNIAIAVAVARGAVCVATAVHAGDHAIYPDCRPAFIRTMELCAHIANEGFIDPRFRLSAPYVNIGKHDIATIGARLGVDYSHTWSCYEGGAVHCGKCGTCVERKEAFSLAGLADPTVYA